jgi:hypothetical protein
MKTAPLGLLLAAALIPSLASAQVSLGLRTGYALPAGDAYDQSGLGGTFAQKDLARAMVPVQAEASWRLSPTLSAGVYLAYGIGQTGAKLGDLCSSPGASCDGPTETRYGVLAAYGLGPRGPVEPWLGLSAGIASTSFKVDNLAYGVLEGTLRGWDAQVEGGADFPMTQALRVGPLLSLGIGQYRVQRITQAGQGTVAGGGVTTPKTHEWITLGVRGRFDI